MSATPAAPSSVQKANDVKPVQSILIRFFAAADSGELLAGEGAFRWLSNGDSPLNKLPSILLYGFGNPGRRDDGAGIFIAEQMRLRGSPGVTIDANYQLNVEDALTISAHDIVIFADASRVCKDSFSLRRLGPEAEASFTTHAMSPASVLALCRRLYDKCPRAFLLEIKGHHWEMKEGLSKETLMGARAALVFMDSWIGRLHGAPPIFDS